MMMLKPGVRLTDLAPQTVLGMMVVKAIFEHRGLPFLVTSVNDSKHGANSWHYKGRAFDARTKYPELDGEEQALRDEIKAALGHDFDVVLEAAGTDNEHLHIEYDPKG